MKAITRLINIASPIDADSNVVDISGFGDRNLHSMMDIGDKRTRRFAMRMTKGLMNLPEALSAAYLQGMQDAVCLPSPPEEQGQ